MTQSCSASLTQDISQGHPLGLWLEHRSRKEFMRGGPQANCEALVLASRFLQWMVCIRGLSCEVLTQCSPAFAQRLNQMD